MPKRSRLQKTGSLISAFFNVWLFNGNPDESISARCYREGVILDVVKWDAARVIVDWLFFWESEHCMNSYLVDLEHAREIIRNG